MQALIDRCCLDEANDCFALLIYIYIRRNNTYGILCRMSTIESSQIILFDQRVKLMLSYERERDGTIKGSDSYGMYIIPECMYTLTQ